MNKRCLYIDESNHSRYPEIVTGVLSPYQEDALGVWVQKINQITGARSLEPGLKKRRGNADIGDLLKKRRFRHVALTQEYIDRVFLGLNRKEKYREEKIKIIAYSELIRHFEPLDLIIIDGMLRNPSLEMIGKMVECLLPQNIIIEPKADETYNGVNIADYISYRLFKHYTGKNQKRDKYKANLIEPGIEEYLELFQISTQAVRRPFVRTVRRNKPKF